MPLETLLESFAAFATLVVSICFNHPKTDLKAKDTKPPTRSNQHLLDHLSFPHRRRSCSCKGHWSTDEMLALYHGWDMRHCLICPQCCKHSDISKPNDIDTDIDVDIGSHGSPFNKSSSTKPQLLTPRNPTLHRLLGCLLETPAL